MFRLKVRTARPTTFQFKNRLSSVREVETSFRRMNVTGNGRLTREEMLSGDEFTREEIEAMFELGDLDRNGQLDLSEFVGKQLNSL